MVTMSEIAIVSENAVGLSCGCPICGGVLRWSIPWRRDKNTESLISESYGNDEYRWFLCRTCGNCYPTFVPRLEVWGKLWDRNRDLSDDDKQRQAEIWRYRKEISRRGAHRSYNFVSEVYEGQPGRFIDIGCGLGETVKLFAELGWKAQGIDADPNMRPFHEALGITSQIGQVEAIDLQGKFDVVHTAHAIYFVQNPRSFVAWMREHMTDDGVLCVVLADFLKSDDPESPGFAHSFYPTCSSMRYLLALEGLQVVASKKVSGSIFIAARKGEGPLPSVHPSLIRFGFQSKGVRYRLFGKPLTKLKSVIKRLLGRARAV